MDKQIIINYLQIFILPFVLGVGLRLAFKRFSKAWIVTVMFAFLSMIWTACCIFGLGKYYEAHPLLAVQSIIAFAGALGVGLFSILIEKRRASKEL